MSQTPNFDQIATKLCKGLDDPWGHPVANDIMRSFHRQIMEQLSLVWNARGAADEDAVFAEFGGPTLECLRAAASIRILNR